MRYNGIPVKVELRFVDYPKTFMEEINQVVPGISALDSALDHCRLTGYYFDTKKVKEHTPLVDKYLKEVGVVFEANNILHIYIF